MRYKSLYDRAKQKVYLVRDRFGKKPLHSILLQKIKPFLKVG